MIAIAALAIAAFQFFAVLFRLRMDLFDKRFDLLKDIEAAAIGRMAEINEASSSNELKSEQLSRFWQAKRRAELLFKQPVQDAIEELEKALREVLSAHMALKHSGEYDHEAYERWISANFSVQTALTRVSELVDPYIEMRSGLLSPFRGLISDNILGR